MDVPPPFRTTLKADGLDGRAMVLIRDLMRCIEEISDHELDTDAYLDHPAELVFWEFSRVLGPRPGRYIGRLPFSLNRSGVVRRAVDRAVADARSEGMAWTPTLDLLSFAREWDLLEKNDRAPTRRSLLDPLVEWLHSGPAAEKTAELTAFDAPVVQNVVATHARSLTEEHWDQLAQNMAVVPDLLANAHVTSPEARTRTMLAIFDRWFDLQTNELSGGPSPYRDNFVAEAKDRRDALQKAVGSGGLPPDLMTRMMDARGTMVRDRLVDEMIFWDPDVPEWVLRELALSSDSRTTRDVLKSACCTEALLAELLDPEDETREAQAQNLVLQMVQDSPSYPIGSQRLERAFFGEAFGNVNTASTLLRHPDSTPHMWTKALEIYQGHDKSIVMQALASHSQARNDPDVRAELDRSRSRRVLEALLEGSTPEEFPRLFSTLYKIDPHDATEWLEYYDPPAGASLDADLLAEILVHPNRDVRLKATMLVGADEPNRSRGGR